MAKFRLEPVLKLRKHREDACKRELAKALAAETEMKSRALRLAQMRQDESGQFRVLQQAGPLDLTHVIEQRRYIGLLDREINLRLTDVAQAEHVTVGYRRKMVDAMKDRKALEVLESRFLDEVRRKEMKVESAALDEAGLIGHRRQERNV